MTTTTPYLLADVSDIDEVYYSDDDVEEPNKRLSLYQKGLMDLFNLQYRIIYRSIKLTKRIDINMFIAGSGHYDENWSKRYYELCKIKNYPKRPLHTFLAYCISLIKNEEDKKTAVCFSYNLQKTARLVLWRKKNLSQDTITTPEDWYGRSYIETS